MQTTPVFKFAHWTLFGLATLIAGCGGPVQTVQLLPSQESGAVGAALLFDRGVDTEVSLQTEGGTDKNPELAHIRTGPCDPSGSARGYVLENLSDVINGRSVTWVRNRPVGDLLGSRYHICVQNSADPSHCETCGEIP